MAKRLSMGFGKTFSFGKSDSKLKFSKAKDEVETKTKESDIINSELEKEELKTITIASTYPTDGESKLPNNTVTIASNNFFHCEQCGALNEIETPPKSITNLADEEITIKNLLDHMKQILISKDKNECENLKQEICNTIIDIKTPATINESKSLLEAAESGDVVAINIFISLNSDVNYQNECGNSALHIASMHGHLEAANVLLNAGADVKIKNKNLEVSLHVAARNGHANIAKLFLGRGVFVDIRNIDNNTPLHLATANDKANVVQMLLEIEADAEIKNNTNKTPYYYATDEDVVLAYITNINSITAKRVDKETLFFKSVKKGWIKVVDLLIQSKININCKEKDTGNTPLHIAAKEGKTEVALLLLKNNANSNLKNEQNYLPLHYAAMQNHLLIKLLHAKQANLDIQGAELRTPLMIAAWHYKIQNVEYLLNNGADLNKRDKNGWTALHYAVFGRCMNTIEILLERGADVNAMDLQGLTPLGVAIDNGHKLAADRLLVRGATPVK